MVPYQNNTVNLDASTNDVGMRKKMHTKHDADNGSMLCKKQDTVMSKLGYIVHSNR